ncbi:hypothetical protein GCM10027160_29440 [Streptomyces calidiresistens]|uniref:Uncharacterized protein n=1 Tax=Streptomyces calidiresistens TaxID=1485586 RepID=A0A7W3T1G0_9ACTN|nr:hypothetical protein [Streptomyces calidiresistens]MBB0229135.1 hypothetical protein [Streptomyces calidiresistens]
MTTIKRNYNLDEAAKILGCGRRHLIDNIGRYQHQRFGRSIVMDDEDIAANRELARRRPGAASQMQAETTVRHLRDVKPKQGRGGRRARTGS